MIGRRLHHPLGRGFLTIDHVPQQHFESPYTFGLAQADELLHTQDHFLLANLGVHGLERQRHWCLRLGRFGTRHRVQCLGDLGGDVSQDCRDRGSQKARGRVFIFER